MDGGTQCRRRLNHSFVDGNKRTALVSTVAFYALNEYSLDYGNEIRSLLTLALPSLRPVNRGQVIIAAIGTYSIS